VIKVRLQTAPLRDSKALRYTEWLICTPIHRGDEGSDEHSYSAICVLISGVLLRYGIPASPGPT
jgi:hypothetical protein